jgi:1A family penicillin-binding protein
MAKFHTPPPYKKTRAFITAHLKSLLALVVGLGLLGGGVFLVWAATLQIPDLNSIATRKIDQSVTLYDRTGEVALYNLNSNVSRTIVPLAEISPTVQNATIAIEDPNFYGHRGIEIKAIIRAIVADVVPGGLTQGGSTLTQQVVKNTLLTNKKSIVRKVKEWILAIKLERVLSKNQILELYLNQAPYGGNIYGVESASQTFFGVRASDLTLSQAAYLAAVLPAPTYYSPYGPHKTELDKRKNLVLDKMFEHGYITATERDEAKKEVLSFKSPRNSSITAPHFVFYVQQYLEQKYGQDALEQNGWKVVTTLDANLQTKAEEVVQARAETNEKNFNATNTGVIALDPSNGNILAMVGSRNYFDDKIDGNYNVTLADRQPGSAFKPFAYAEAFIKGYTPDTVLFDVPTQFSTSCAPEDTTNSKAPCYAPVNYDNKFLGPMTLRDAIAQSRNIPSVKVLYLAGITDTLRLAKAMGVSTLGDPNQYGLTLVLGGGEVTLLDMSSAYGVFAQNGMRYQPISVLKIIDSTGNTIEDNTQPVGSQVIQADAAQKINDILSDSVARAPLGENDLLSFPGRDVAVKTGTTNNYKDAWTIGYTPNLVLGMWVGNNDNTSMVHKVSGFIVGPMWHEIMQYALSETANQSFTRSEYDASSLKPILRGIWQTPGSDGSIHEILYWVDKNNPLGAQPAYPQNDSQYAYWEVGVQRWLAQHGAPALPQPVVPQEATGAASSN